ncbi:MAG TPA: DUF6587 family protein [Steroidobacteraceae bacterium]|nr:DUF6587 family protein [Steroidobacteraceae bacterium]
MQEAIVALLVVFAAAFSTWKLMPARRRLQALVALDNKAAGFAALAGFRERSLKPRIAKAAGSGCAGCAANAGARPQSSRR